MSELDLGLGVLDHQLVDIDDRVCGKVDDLELDLEHKDGARVTAILSGPGAWRGRGRLGRLASNLARGSFESVCIGWNDVDEVEATVKLRRPAAQLGLAAVDLELEAVLSRLPGGRL
jgi:hypothetical protein